MKKIEPSRQDFAPNNEKAKITKVNNLKTSYDFLAPNGTADSSLQQKTAYSRPRNLNQTFLLPEKAYEKKHVQTFVHEESWKFQDLAATPKYRGIGPKEKKSNILEQVKVGDKWAGSQKRERVNGYMNSKKLDSIVFSSDNDKKERWEGKKILGAQDIVKEMGKKSFIFHYPSHQFAIAKSGKSVFYMQ